MESQNFIQRLSERLEPLSMKLGNQKHLRAISDGMFFSLPFMVIGAFFLIIANPPINLETFNPEKANIFIKFLAAWKTWAVANYDAITTPYNLTFGLVGLLSAFGIAYSLAKHYKLNAATVGLMAMIIDLIVCVTLKKGNINLDYLGANGLFVAIILGLAVTEICRYLDQERFKLKLPDSVPPMVAIFIGSLLPLLVNIIFFYGLNLMFISAFKHNFPTVVMNILTPGIDVAGSLWGLLIIVTIGQILWLFGINGTSIIFPIIFTIGISQTGANAEQLANGQTMTHLMNLQMFRVSVLGGAGNTLGLVLLMMRSKLPEWRTLGKLSLIPGICSINEPIIFGMPLVFNPLLSIPFILTPVISLILTYLAEYFHIISNGYIVDPSFTPFFAQAYLSSLDWRNVVFNLLLVAVSVLVYYPFFKVYEGSKLKERQK